MVALAGGVGAWTPLEWWLSSAASGRGHQWSGSKERHLRTSEEACSCKVSWEMGDPGRVQTSQGMQWPANVRRWGCGGEPWWSGSIPWLPARSR